MAEGKDPETADYLGGVHKVVVDRPTVPAVPKDAEPVVVAEGERAGFSRLVDDPDQIAKVVHTIDMPIEPESGANARESTLRPTRTERAPHQDVQTTPDEASVWTAAKDPAGP